MYTLIARKYPKAYKGAVKALNARNSNKKSGNDIMIDTLSDKIVPLVNIEPIKRNRQQSDLESVGIMETPEMYKARAISKGVLYAMPFCIFAVVTPVFLLLAVFVCILVTNGEEKKLKTLTQNRKRSIEKELPQFASTIRQSLAGTRSIITILESYGKVCGENLRREIQITLNDLKTGNTERALGALNARVSSGKFSELTRGLVGISRGDDVKVYFDMLTVEYQKAENEAVKKELLNRPSKLNKYIMVLFACLFLLTLLAMGMMISSKAQLFFN